MTTECPACAQRRWFDQASAEELEAAQPGILPHTCGKPCPYRCDHQGLYRTFKITDKCPFHYDQKQAELEMARDPMGSLFVPRE